MLDDTGQPLYTGDKLRAQVVSEARLVVGSSGQASIPYLLAYRSGGRPAG